MERSSTGAFERRMKKAVVLDADDIKKIVAKEFGVPEKDVIKS